MDIINRALERKLYITDNLKLKNQTWEEFEEAAQTKRVWIFGAGKATEFFWEKYDGFIPIDGVLDNDERKQGKWGIQSKKRKYWCILVAMGDMEKKYLND